MITDAQIIRLRDEASSAGDEAAVNLCDAALGLAEAWMQDEAREQVAAMIQSAADALDGDDLYRYDDDEHVGKATDEDRAASYAAAKLDGGPGIFRRPGDDTRYYVA